MALNLNFRSGLVRLADFGWIFVYILQLATCVFSLGGPGDSPKNLALNFLP